MRRHAHVDFQLFLHKSSGIPGEFTISVFSVVNAHTEITLDERYNNAYEMIVTIMYCCSVLLLNKSPL